ncbi:winged helix-turn-helix domain-containing protein [Nonomuraea sp. MTCD27]|uniref:winged helix-turn-helix domain-containing protein n=1 Tax=Nonomuraea sp. MTCD27 TaxID=1676747 RepID=UPI0035C18A02
MNIRLVFGGRRIDLGEVVSEAFEDFVGRCRFPEPPARMFEVLCTAVLVSRWDIALGDDRSMQYGQRGGCTPAEQERRERVRLQAAEWFEAGESTRQWARLDAELRRGPPAWGYVEDQCWTLDRVKTLIGRLFHIGYTIEGVGKLLHRHGWSVQMPARRALERDEEAIALWKAEVWPAVKAPRRTWAPVGARPVVTVRGRGSGRINMAGVVCYRDSERPHLFYRLHIYHGRKGEPKTFSWMDYRDLIVAVHQHLTHRRCGAATT